MTIQHIPPQEFLHPQYWVGDASLLVDTPCWERYVVAVTPALPAWVNIHAHGVVLPALFLDINNGIYILENAQPQPALVSVDGGVLALVPAHMVPETIRAEGCVIARQPVAPIASPFSWGNYRLVPIGHA